MKDESFTTVYTCGEETLIFSKFPTCSLTAHNAGRVVEGMDAADILMRLLAPTNRFVMLKSA